MFPLVDATPGRDFWVVRNKINKQRIEGTTMKIGKSFWTVSAILVLVAAGFDETAQAQTFVSSGFNMNARVDAAFNFDCTNHPGPVISLPNGKITLGSVDGEITLSNNYKFTHSDEVAVSADVSLLFP